MIDVKTVSDIINEITPYGLAQEYDNCGVSLDLGNNAEKILFALDVSAETITEAERLRCGILVTHHPAIIVPQNRFSINDNIILAAAKGISLIAAHTCFDSADGGVNDCLCDILGLRDVEKLDDIARGGTLDAVTCQDFIEHVKQRLNCENVIAVPSRREIRKVAVAGGSAGESLDTAIERSYDALVTGEAKHHAALKAKAHGLCLVCAGHFVTENPSVKVLMDLASAKIGDRVECILSESGSDPIVFY